MANRKKFIWQFVIDGDSDRGVKALRQQKVAVEEIGEAEKKVTKGRVEHTKVTDQLWSSITRLAGPIGIGLLTAKFAETVRQTELLKGQLVTMTGSTDRASLAFDKLNKFAAQTPFTLDQSVQGFVKLTALGLTPSERALESYGNTAAAMGKSLNQMIEAVADVSTMEFERLKEFGIKARQQADTVTFTFQGVETVVQKNAEAIEGYLMGIGENQFGDAMANQMERIPGLLSNLQDSWDNLFRTFGEEGGTELFSNVVKGSTKALQIITEHVDEIDRIYIELIAGLEVAWSTWSAEFQKRLVNLQLNFDGFGADIVSIFEIAIAHISASWNSFLTTLRSAYGEFIAFAAEAIDLIPGSGDIADRMRDTALEFRRAAAGGENFSQRIERAEASLEARRRDRDKQRAAAHEQIQAQHERNLAAINRRVQAYIDERSSAEDTDTALEDLAKTRDEDASAIDSETAAAKDLVAELEEELRLLGATELERQFANATRELSAEAIQAQGTEIRRLLGLIEAEKEAQKQLAAEQKQADRIRRNQIEGLQRGIESLLDDFFDRKRVDVGDFFDFILKSWGETVKKMAAANITSAIFGGGGALSAAFPGSGSGSGFNPLNLLSLGGLGNIGANIGGFAQGLLGIGQGASGFVGPMTQAATSGANMAALITSPAGIAAMAAVAGKFIYDITSDPDGFKREIGGFLAAPTPGAPIGSQFAVDPFASGFSPIGFADATTKEIAQSVIEPFRALDSTIVDLVRILEGNLATPGTLGGFGLDGVGAGTLFGRSQRTTDAQFLAQLDSFARQLVDHVSGLDDELMRRLDSANTAGQIVQILTEAADGLEDLAAAESELNQVREEATRVVTSSIDDLLRLSDSAAQLGAQVRSDIFRLLGVSELRPATGGGSPAEQLADLADLRAFLLEQHRLEVDMERELHEERVRNYREQLQISKSIGNTITGLLTGELSHLSAEQKFDLAMSEFSRLAGLAEGGDLDAARQLGGAGEAAIRQIRDRFASSAHSKSLTQGVIDRLASVQGSLSGAIDPGAFDSSALDQELVRELELIQEELQRIQADIADQAVEELKTISELLTDLPKALITGLAKILRNAQDAGPIDGEGGFQGNPAATPEAIRAFADQVLAGPGTEDQKIHKFITTAIVNGVTSGQVASALGFSEQQVLDFASRVGLPAFADGGIVSAPTIGIVGERRKREAIVPLPDGFDVSSMGNADVVRELRVMNSKVDVLTQRVSRLDEVHQEAAALRSDFRQASEHAARQRSELQSVEESMDEKLGQFEARKSSGVIG